MPSTVVKVPIKDVMIDSNAPNTNYSGYYALILGSYSSKAIYRDLIQFDLSAIPPGYYIPKAEIVLYIIRNDNPSLTKTFNVFRLTQNFIESTVTYNNQPSAFQSPNGSFRLTNELNTFVRIDITELVREWYDGNHPNYGLMLRAENESSGSLVVFYNSNYSNEYYYPKLEISLEEPAQVSSRSFSYVKEGPLITGDSYKYSQSFDMSKVSQFTFFVNNLLLTNSCNILLQISPDGVNWCNDSIEYTVAPGELKPLVSKIFSKYVRIAYKSASAGNSTRIDIHSQMQS